MVAFCRCFCGFSAIHYLLLYAILSASCIFLYSFFWVVSQRLNFVCQLSEQSVYSIIISGESRTPYTHCNFTMFSVSVRTQIGTVGGAEHNPTTERETGRLNVFPVTEFQHQLLAASVGRVSAFQSCTVSWATGTRCYRHVWWVIYSRFIVPC